jgi:hypothetical protein
MIDEIKDEMKSIKVLLWFINFWAMVIYWSIQ